MPTKKDTIMVSDTPSKEGTVGGKIEMSEDVVATIANYAARAVNGIANLGKAGILYRSIGDDPTRGVAAEVGETQAAIDLEVVIEYGCDIQKTAGELRQKIADEVARMAGRQVIEVNIKVVGIQMEEEKAEPAPEPAPRVK